MPSFAEKKLISSHSFGNYAGWLESWEEKRDSHAWVRICWHPPLRTWLVMVSTERRAVQACPGMHFLGDGKCAFCASRQHPCPLCVRTSDLSLQRAGTCRGMWEDPGADSSSSCPGLRAEISEAQAAFHRLHPLYFRQGAVLPFKHTHTQLQVRNWHLPGSFCLCRGIFWKHPLLLSPHSHPVCLASSALCIFWLFARGLENPARQPFAQMPPGAVTDQEWDTPLPAQLSAQHSSKHLCLEGEKPKPHVLTACHLSPLENTIKSFLPTHVPSWPGSVDAVPPAPGLAGLPGASALNSLCSWSPRRE